EAVGVGPVLSDQQRRSHGAHQGRDRGTDRADPAGGIGAGGQRHVDRAAGGGGASAVLHEASAGEQPLARLVDGQGHRPGFVPQSQLDAIAVVDVDADVHHPLLTRIQGVADGDGGIVVDAEADLGTLIGLRGAEGPPLSCSKPVTGSSRSPVRWTDRVTARGSSHRASSTPSPWWTSTSTYITRSSPASRAWRMAMAASL